MKPDFFVFVSGGGRGSGGGVVRYGGGGVVAYAGGEASNHWLPGNVCHDAYVGGRGDAGVLLSIC